MGCNNCKNGCKTKEEKLACVPHAVYELSLEKARRDIFCRDVAIAILGGVLLISNILWVILR